MFAVLILVGGNFGCHFGMAESEEVVGYVVVVLFTCSYGVCL